MNSKVITLVIGAVLVLILFFVGLLYYTLRTKVQVVSKNKPFDVLLLQQNKTKRLAYLMKQPSGLSYKYEYALMEDSSQVLDGAEVIALAMDTKLKINEAHIYTNGTSGFKHAVVLGEVFVPSLNRAVNFEYTWGNCHFSLYKDFQEYWTFPLAIWQDTALKEKYYFK